MSIEILTPRLLLRPPLAEDLEGWARFHDDPVAMAFLGGLQHRHQAWRSLCSVAGSWALFGYGMFSVIERESGAWIGRIGPWCPANWPGTEVGWGILTAYRGKGLAYEAAAASMNFAIDKLGWTKIVHSIDPGNTSSIALAERLGSICEGPTQLPPPCEQMEVKLWSQTAQEWKQRRGRQIGI